MELLAVQSNQCSWKCSDRMKDKENKTQREKNIGRNHCQGLSLMKTTNLQIKEVQQTHSE